jgi:uncharacterized protein (DUF983 family)
MGFGKKGTKLHSISSFKCPKCHEGDLFETKIMDFKEPFKMKDGCEHCQQRYMIEPGFYWGAMYVAYGLSSGLMLTGSAIGLILLDWSVNQTFAVLIALLIVLYVLIFRLARSIWINIYVHYDKNRAKKIIKS